MITAWRKSAALAARIAQPPVVEDLQEEVEDARLGLLELVQQHDAERLAADPADQRRVVELAVARASAARSPGSGTRSCRAGSSGRREPNRYSASALAISVLPVPVGPTNSSTACGRVGSVSPALSSATRSTMHSTASGWPITRAAKNARSASTSSRSRSSSSDGRQPGALGDRRQHVGHRQRRRRPAGAGASPPAARAARPAARRRRGSGGRARAPRAAPRDRCRRGRAASASVRALVHRLDPHDVERVAHRRAARAPAARSRPGRRCPAMCTRASAMPARAAGRARRLRVLARDARVQQRLELRARSTAPARRRACARGARTRPSSSPT